jgi:hypothetical protein
MDKLMEYYRWRERMTIVCNSCDLKTCYNENKSFYMQKAKEIYQFYLFNLDYLVGIKECSEDNFCLIFYTFLNISNGNDLAKPLIEWLNNSENHPDRQHCGENTENAKRCFAIHVCRNYLRKT